MDDWVRETLISLIDEYGLDLANDPRRLGGLLNDACRGGYRPERRVLLMALEVRVVSDLGSAIKASSVSVTVDRLSSQLSDNFGLREDVARWAIVSWAQALNAMERGHDARALIRSSELAKASGDKSSGLRGDVRASSREAEIASRFGQSNYLIAKDLFLTLHTEAPGAPLLEAGVDAFSHGLLSEASRVVAKSGFKRNIGEQLRLPETLVQLRKNLSRRDIGGLLDGPVVKSAGGGGKIDEEWQGFLRWMLGILLTAAYFVVLYSITIRWELLPKGLFGGGAALYFYVIVMILKKARASS